MVEETTGETVYRLQLSSEGWRPPVFAAAPDGGGYLLYLRESALVAQPFHIRALRTTGEAAPVAGDGRRDIPRRVHGVGHWRAGVWPGRR